LELSVKTLGAMVFTYFLILTFIVLYTVDNGGSVANIELANLENSRPDIPDQPEYVDSDAETSFFERFFNGIQNGGEFFSMIFGWLWYLIVSVFWFIKVLMFPLTSELFTGLFKLFYALPPLTVVFGLVYSLVKVVRGS